MYPILRRETILRQKNSAMLSYVKSMCHQPVKITVYYFPQCRCNTRKISAKRYRRAKLGKTRIFIQYPCLQLIALLRGSMKWALWRSRDAPSRPSMPKKQYNGYKFINVYDKGYRPLIRLLGHL